MGKLPLKVTKIALQRYADKGFQFDKAQIIVRHNGIRYAVPVWEVCQEAADILGAREKQASDIALYPKGDCKEPWADCRCQPHHLWRYKRDDQDAGRVGMRRFRHLKSGHLYELLHEAVECTNARAFGTPFHANVMVYCRIGSQFPTIFVRDRLEFEMKFKEVKDDGSQQDPD